MFRKAKPKFLGVGSEVSLIRRLVDRIEYYIESEGPLFFANEGVERAAAYISDLKALSPHDRNDDVLFRKVLNDISEQFGTGVLGTSMALRTRLACGLAEHLNINIALIDSHIRDAQNKQAPRALSVYELNTLAINTMYELLGDEFFKQVGREMQPMNVRSKYTP